MGKIKNVMYYCSKCKKSFPVRGFISKELIKFDKKAVCTHCGHNETNRYGHIKKTRKPVTSMESPPSEGQKSYIKGLGGDPNKIKNKREAGEYIGRLKQKQKEENYV